MSWNRFRRDEDGSAGGFALIALLGCICLLIVLGLVVDGGAKASSADRANRIAMEAARAGAQVLTVGSGSVDQAVQAYLAVEGVTGTSTVAGDRVDVTVHFSAPTKILSMIGINEIGTKGEGFAYAVYGTPGGP